MNYLLIHQNCPGQFAHVAARLAALGNRVVFLTQAVAAPVPGAEIVLYERHRNPHPGTHHYLTELELGVLNGQAAYERCRVLDHNGFVPDVILGHAGWGEMLFLKDIWPRAPILSYLEFFYRLVGADVGFENEPIDADAPPRIRAKNAISLLSFDSCDRAITPTEWQRSGFPDHIQRRMTVQHEGVDTNRASPDPQARLVVGNEMFSAGEEIITFVARNLEPYRGFHILMRTLPEVLRRRPSARVLIVGGDGLSYGASHPSGRSWKSVVLEEVGEDIDRSRVRFLDQIPYESYLGVLKVSAVHVYLTYPFVLSWSCLEALSAGCLVIGSRTQPVEEVIGDGENGILTDFGDTRGLADRLVNALANPAAFKAMRVRARETCIEKYDLERVTLPRYLELLNDIREGSAA
jgi:glycosyltransferase involved in cell wall biosynthesis